MSELLRRRGEGEDIRAARAVGTSARARRAGRRLRAVPQRPWARALIALLAAVMFRATWSLAQALTAPGHDSVTARTAGRPQSGGG